jgi:hypothetical protein
MLSAFYYHRPSIISENSTSHSCPRDDLARWKPWASAVDGGDRAARGVPEDGFLTRPSPCLEMFLGLSSNQPDPTVMAWLALSETSSP